MTDPNLGLNRAHWNSFTGTGEVSKGVHISPPEVWIQFLNDSPN